MQAHMQLECVTNATGGLVALTTATGTATDIFDKGVLLQPAVITGVTPTVWSTTGVTVITITGTQYVFQGKGPGLYFCVSACLLSVVYCPLSIVYCLLSVVYCLQARCGPRKWRATSPTGWC
jgi:hypothetical protein